MPSVASFATWVARLDSGTPLSTLLIALQ
jgi:hypothetical protein